MINCAFYETVTLKPGESCNWKKHFRGVMCAVIGYLEAQALLHPQQRFAWNHIESIVTGASRYRASPYSRRAVAYALEHLQVIGLIAPVAHAKLFDRNYHGWLVAPHSTSCKLDTDGNCHYICAGLETLGYTAPGRGWNATKKVLTGVRFHGPDICGPHCPDCSAALAAYAKRLAAWRKAHGR